MVDGAASALPLVEELEPDLAGFRPFHGVRGELLEQVGQTDAAIAAFLQAAELPGNTAEAEVLRRRAAGLGWSRQGADQAGP
jgi:predicted RNA polymerase sigma factor